MLVVLDAREGRLMLWEITAYLGALVGLCGFIGCVVLAAKLDVQLRRERAYLASRHRELRWAEDIRP